MNSLELSSIVSKSEALSVSELNRQIKSVIDGEFPQLWISGELSNIVHHRSGHLYFTLKDKSSEIRGVMFRGFSQFLPFTPEDGMNVLVFGSISVYEPRGQYQIVVKQMEAEGIGSLFLAFEALKKKLSAEGIFADEFKKPIPKYPKSVGIITSSSGAAVKDILNVMERRVPHVSVYLRPALVQGEGAADDLVSALNQLEKEDQVDVIIIGRGGGSLEDLWSFNEEILARAISKCQMPVISAVGHETDYTLSDFAADLRAPTPSVAAELVAVPLIEILSYLDYLEEKLVNQIQSIMNSIWQKLDNYTGRNAAQEPTKKISQYVNALSGYNKNLSRGIDINLKLKKTKINAFFETLTALSPRGVLERGYSIAYTFPVQKIISKSGDLKTGDLFILETGNGRFQAEKTKEMTKHSSIIERENE
tara:strand:- start:346 stop:1608 length:1263 start_codon:yes stop_codon:yes gene_type:complete